MNLPPSNQILHQAEAKSWFNSRCPSKVKLQYLKSTQEIMNDNIVTNTFKLIDKDQSKTLEIEELYAMFQKNGYPININLLRGFFEKADKDNNSNNYIYKESIELEEFKHIVYDEQATQSFRQMMRKMREQSQQFNYYSTDFLRLLRYLKYCQDRNDLQFQITNHRLPVEKRSILVSKLIKLNSQYNQEQLQAEEEIQPRPYKKINPERKILPPISSHYIGTKPIFASSQQLKINLSDVQKNLSLSSSPQFISPQNTDRSTRLTSVRYINMQKKIFNKKQ